MALGKTKVRIIVVAVIVALLVVIKIMNAPEQSDARKQRSGGKSEKAVVSVVVVKPQKISESIISSGTIVADQDISIQCEAAGRIASLSFKEGAFVRKGQLLVKINAADLEAQLAKAQAALNLAQEKEKRQKMLLDKAAISAEDYEVAAQNLAASQADVRLIEAQIAKTEVTAPFDGVIGLTTLATGGYVMAGTPVARLVSLRPLKIEFAVPERYVPKIRPGSELYFVLDGVEQPYTARVIALEPRINESTRTLSLRALCTNPDSRVTPGAFARVEMTIQENDQALMVPSEALVPDINGYKIFTIKSAVATACPVKTGIRNEQNVEITTGLTAGDTVVVSGVLMLRPGMSVQIAEIR